MIDLPLHPKIVHVPLGLAPIMPLLLLLLLVAIYRSWLPLRAWWIGVVFSTLLTGSTWLAMQTGEADEDRVEKVVPEAALDQHEDAAKPFLLATGATLVLTAAVLFVGHRKIAFAVQLASVFAAAGAFGLGVRVGQLGGELVYRHGAAQVYSTGGNPQPAAETHDD